MAEMRAACNDGFYTGPDQAPALFLASVCCLKSFLSLSLSFSLLTILSVKLYILTSQTGRLTFRKGVIIKFRCRNYQNFGWLASSEHDRPNLLELKAPFDETFPKYFRLTKIFLTVNYFADDLLR